MLIYTREKLASCTQEVTALINSYQSRDGRFPYSAIAWLTSTEQSLNQLRHPLVALVAAQRAKILAVEDGYRHPSLGGAHVTMRRAMNVCASLAVEAVQAELRACIAALDARLDTARDKMAQFLAVATAKVAVPLPPTDPRDVWLATVWADLNVNGETQGMYRYLCASLSPADRLHLLDEVLTNLLDGLPH